MRITDTQRPYTAYAEASAKSRNSGAGQTIGTQDMVGRGFSGSLTLPDLLHLTSTQNPRREAFLTALSESLRAGLHTSDPAAVAKSILRSGFDAAEPAK